jgi:NADPH:quinone reductase-like Zn-dependent oxidoreductase
MKAIRVHEPADIGGLVFEEAPDAKPLLCDVLVKVAACGITHNEPDYPVWTCRAGHQRTLTIPSAEMSGVVAALGSGDRRDRRKRRGIRADRPVASRDGRRVRRRRSP